MASLGKYDAILSGGNNQGNIPQNTQSTQQPKFPQLNGILQLLGGFGGATGGGALGAAAGALVPGADLTGIPEVAGGYAGGVAGAGAGAGAGNALADYLRGNLLGDKTINFNQTLPQSEDAAKAGAIGQAIGVPAAKGLGFIAHPIQPFIDMVDQKLASSSKTVDFGQLLNTYKDNVLPKLRQQGFGQQATDAYNQLSANIADAVRAFKEPAEKAITTGQTEQFPKDISSMELPIAQANQLKRNLSQQVTNYYGFDTGKPNIEAVKKFGNVLKNNIEQQVPSVNKMGPGDIFPGGNQVASALYKVPDTLGALTSVLGLGNPQAARAINTIASLPTGIAQKLIPSGGGYLNQVLPRLLQLAVGAAGGNQ